MCIMMYILTTKVNVSCRRRSDHEVAPTRAPYPRFARRPLWVFAHRTDAAQVMPIEFRVVREIAHQNSVHVDVERDGPFLGAQGSQLLIGACRSQVGPVIDYMQVGARHTI